MTRRAGSRCSAARLDRRHELISDSPHGLDLRVGVGQLVAQLLHVDVHGARFTRIREPPNVLEEAVAGKGDPRLPAEGFEELELLRAQSDRAVTDVHLVTRRSDADVPSNKRAA